MHLGQPVAHPLVAHGGDFGGYIAISLDADGGLFGERGLDFGYELRQHKLGIAHNRGVGRIVLVDVGLVVGDVNQHFVVEQVCAVVDAREAAADAEYEVCAV